MIKIDGEKIELGHYPDGTLLIKGKDDSWQYDNEVNITWLYESDEELVALIFITNHLKRMWVEDISLWMPYIPNARMDRVKEDSDVFTLKYFAEIINSLGFSEVDVFDPHSNVSTALIDRVFVVTPEEYVRQAMRDIPSEDLLLFYPDEGAAKRYSDMFDRPYAFGIKKRDWKTGEIQGLDVAGNTELIKGKDILIVDDICSRGGTFYHSAKKLKELGARNIYLYISHCENTILKGDLLTSGLIERVYTTNSIFTKEHERIEVFDCDEY